MEEALLTLLAQIDPLTLSLILSSAASGAASKFGIPEGTEIEPLGDITPARFDLSPFELEDLPAGSEVRRRQPTVGEGGKLSPADILGIALGEGLSLGSTLTERANAPISLPGAVAQPLPAFAGGGLPLPIGVTGRDPALDNPSLLTDAPRRTPSTSTPGAIRRPGQTGDRGGGASTLLRRPSGGRDLLAGTSGGHPSDAEKASGALDLLVQAASPRRRT